MIRQGCWKQWLIIKIMFLFGWVFFPWFIIFISCIWMICCMHYMHCPFAWYPHRTEEGAGAKSCLLLEQRVLVLIHRAISPVSCFGLLIFVYCFIYHNFFLLFYLFAFFSYCEDFSILRVFPRCCGTPFLIDNIISSNVNVESKDYFV